MKKRTSIVIALLTISYLLGAQLIYAQIHDNENINWHTFQWETHGNTYFTNTPHKVIVTNLKISGIPDLQKFTLDLSTPFSYLYDFAYDGILYRNPSFAEKSETVQRITNFSETVVREIELSVEREVLGLEDMTIKKTDEANRNTETMGTLGFGIFHKNKKILLVDNPGGRFASMEELPAALVNEVSFVPMRVEAGYLVIPVTIEEKVYDMFFDGTSRPALIVFNNRLFKQTSSNVPASEKLSHLESGNNRILLDGYEPSADLLFNGMDLQEFNVYKSSERVPSGIKGVVSRAFFDDYVMIFDYKNGRFGLLKPESLAK
jgi:hypothetical protein